MPQIKNISTPTGGIVGVWKIDESESFFLDRMNAKDYQKHSWDQMSLNRRLEYLSGRYLASQLLDHPDRLSIRKNADGKPFLNDNRNISFSHSKKMVATAIGMDTTGVDIQIKTKRLKPLAYKFLNEEEAAQLRPYDLLEQLHVYWGIKETLYKIHGKPDLFFARDIRVFPFAPQPEGFVKASIRNKQYQGTYLLKYQWIDDHLLVYIIQNLDFEPQKAITA